MIVLSQLYNLKTDLEENLDLAGDHPDLVNQLSEELFAFLKEAGARYPEADPEYSEALEKEYLLRVINTRWPQLEKQRLDFLSEDFNPGNQWWGSMVTDD